MGTLWDLSLIHLVIDQLLCPIIHMFMLKVGSKVFAFNTQFIPKVSK